MEVACFTYCTTNFDNIIHVSLHFYYNIYIFFTSAVKFDDNQFETKK